MDIIAELARSLELRFSLYIGAEDKGDVSSLYTFIDPRIRTKRDRENEFEPDYTLSKIEAFVAQIHSAEVRSFAIDKFTNDGGLSRDHRPTALVISQILYNSTQVADFRTPWVLDDQIWYTRSLGKHKAFDR